jgi:alkyl hydroperoxide reductase subunit D
MERIEQLRATFPEPARDVKLNLQSVFQSSSLGPAQLWGTAVASAAASRHPALAAAVLADARERVDEAVVADALAAAALMSMNNVYYRFRHMIGKESYSQKPARLRMNWIGKPQGSKADFELFCLAVSAINGCEACVRSHEEVVLKGELTEEQVHDAVRVASTIHAAAVSLEIGDLVGQAAPATA